MSKLDPKGIEASLMDYYADPNLYPTDDIYTDSQAHEAMCNAIHAYCEAAGVVMVSVDFLSEAIETETEFETEWNKEARAMVAAAQEGE